MKKLLPAVLLAVSLLLLLPGCQQIGYMTVRGNPNPITVLKDISFGDVDAVLVWYDTAAEKIMYPLNDKEQEEAVFNTLKQVQLSGKGNAKVKIDPTQKYDIRLKSGGTLHISFAGPFVDFGEGTQLFENCDKSVFPSEVERIWLNNTDCQYPYEDPVDKETLLRLLTPDPVSDKAHYNAGNPQITVGIAYGNYSDETYAAVKMDAAVYLFKAFFTLNTCLGTIGADDYAQLEIAQKGQFGTRLNFFVTSDSETIYPAGHMVWMTTYDETTEQMAAGDSFPRLSDYLDTLETLRLTKDFSVWMKDYVKCSYVLSRDGETIREGGALTYAGFSGLEAGTYQAAVTVTEQGKYIETLNAYESAAYVYYFQISVG